jgi:DNA ligase D-like protein (predicted 3'-phosphoesterase)
MSKRSRDSKLAAYRSRRDFRRTPEPRGGGGAGLERGEHPIFVVQQHDATTMHWDFRLEVDGVLRSWAVPKGPSTAPSEKRLAVQTEDHPLDYADFEGVIPAGEYGGGAVIVWDAGPYRNASLGDDGEELPIAEALERGHAQVWLEGQKLRGGYVLVHARIGGDERHWLLIKQDDEGADARRRPTKTEPESVLSGRTVGEVLEDEGDG